MELLLQPQQPVDLVLDGGWRMVARVAAVADGHLDLEAADGPLRLPGDLRSCPAAVSWRTRAGAAEHRGLLAEAGGTLRLTTEGAALRVQRRQFVRVPADLPVAIIGDRGRLSARTLDLSIGGLLLAAPAADALALHERVRLVLDLGEVSVRAEGRVVRGSAEGTRAVCFDELQGRVERAISRYVARRQRELIAG